MNIGRGVHAAQRQRDLSWFCVSMLYRNFRNWTHIAYFTHFCAPKCVLLNHKKTKKSCLQLCPRPRPTL